jgi:hypothetical protein
VSSRHRWSRTKAELGEAGAALKRHSVEAQRETGATLGDTQFRNSVENWSSALGDTHSVQC